MAHYTRAQEQDVARAMQLLEQLVGHVDRIATALETLNERDLANSEADEFGYRPRSMFEVELPDEDSVFCPRCQTVQKRSQVPGSGTIAPHDCRPWVSPTEQPGVEETADWQEKPEFTERRQNSAERQLTDDIAQMPVTGEPEGEILCLRCRTMQRDDPANPGYLVEHDCVPWDGEHEAHA